MQSAMSELVDLSKLWPPDTGSFCVGQIVQITHDGRALVDFPGNLMGPVAARSIIDAPSEHGHPGKASIPVLLVFENGDPSLPIIMGMIRDTICPFAASQEITLSRQQPCDVITDGRTMIFDAKEEIILRCGKSSVTLTKDGKIVIKGAEIVSRSSGTHKIKGASVRIN
jgi:hypothetical protein